ncbi:MAG: type II secretion system protein [Patescibacteria group bacterium]
MYFSHNRGFTLIEILLSLAIISVIVATGIPIFQSFQNRNELDIATVTLAQSLRRAQLLAQASDGDTSWGTHTQSGSITLFKGPNYVGRDSTFDEVFTIPTNIIASGTQEYVFSRFTGLPQSTGTLTFTSINNETRTIITNAKGMVSY